MKVKISLVISALISIFAIFFFLGQSHSQIIQTNESPPTNGTYYLLWQNDENPLNDKFIKNIKSLAPSYDINKIYTQNITFNQPTLFYYKNGEIQRRVRADQSSNEIEAFFNNKIYIPEESKYGIIQDKEFSYIIKDIVLSHLITNESDVDIDKNQYIVSVKYYVYNNEKIIKKNINQTYSDLIVKNINFIDENGKKVDPIDINSNMNTANLYIGDRAKGIVSFLLPVNNIDQLRIVLGDDNQQVYPLSEMKLLRTLNDGEFNF